MSHHRLWLARLFQQPVRQSWDPNSILNLQRTIEVPTHLAIGNHAVQRLPQAKPASPETVSNATAFGQFGHDFPRIPVYTRGSVKIQPKLAVNTPGASDEQEADRVSAQVMRMPE